MRGRKKPKTSQALFLAKDIAELTMKRYPKMPLSEVKTALMSAENFIINTMYCYRKDNEKDKIK